MGNGMGAKANAIGAFKIRLSATVELNLVNIPFVLTIRRNLISISKNDRCSYTYNFGNGYFSLYRRSFTYDTGFRVDGLHKLNLNFSFTQSLSLHVRGNLHMVDENYAELWHKHLGYISKQSKQTLVSQEILEKLDFLNLWLCEIFIKVS